MTGKDKLFTFKAFQAANLNKDQETTRVTFFSYLLIIIKITELPIDVIFAFMKLFSPDLKVVNGMIVLTEHYNTRISEREIFDRTGAQHYLNIIEITALSEEISYEEALELATGIVKLWNLKINAEIEDGYGTARTFVDEEFDEVFVTID